MDFKDQIKQVAERVDKWRIAFKPKRLLNNYAIITGNRLRRIQSYGGNARVHLRYRYPKGAKIDSAIIRDGEPIILVECKHWKQPLTLHDNQLLRY